jgi:hypothetical protein
MVYENLPYAMTEGATTAQRFLHLKVCRTFAIEKEVQTPYAPSIFSYSSERYASIVNGAAVDRSGNSSPIVPSDSDSDDFTEGTVVCRMELNTATMPCHDKDRK